MAEQDDLGGPPRWYREIFPAGPRTGFFHNFGGHSAVFVDRGPAQLVISFDNLADAGGRRYDRDAWAAKFIADQGWSHLGIFAEGPSWFRDAMLIDWLISLRDRGFFAGFARVALCGASMGGFAALAFASLAPGATVVAFSPQTTLDEAVVPWESRFAKGRAQDWSLPFSDGVAGACESGRVYVLCDRFCAPDMQHLARLRAVPGLVPLMAVGLGHKSALMLRRMDRLKPVMQGAITGTLTPLDFARLIRNRKDIYLYKTTMDDYLRGRDRPELAERMARAFKARRRARAG